jgi:hypothetical protein
MVVVQLKADLNAAATMTGISIPESINDLASELKGHLPAICCSTLPLLPSYKSSFWRGRMACYVGLYK